MIALIVEEIQPEEKSVIEEPLKQKDIPFTWIETKNQLIKPCYNCGHCLSKVYGECVHKDDMQKNFPSLKESETWVFITPIRFGGYSYEIKKLLDRTCILGDEKYYYHKGEIVKGTKFALKQFIVVGVKPNCSPKEEKIFKELVQENIKIMNVEGKAYVKGYIKEADAVLREVIE